MYVTKQINIDLTGNESTQLLDECQKVINDDNSNGSQKASAQNIMLSLSDGNGRIEILEGSSKYWIQCFKDVDYFGANRILRTLEANFVQTMDI